MKVFPLKNFQIHIIIFLKKLNEYNHKKIRSTENIDKNYLRWMNDFEVHKYTEQKYKKHTIQSIRKFVKEKIKGRQSFFMEFSSKEHIEILNLGRLISTIDMLKFLYFNGDKQFWVEELQQKQSGK